MSLPHAQPDRLQKGFAYFAHAARGDTQFMQAAAEDLGGWQEAANIFAACTTELLHQLAGQLNRPVIELSVMLAERSAALQQGAQPQ